MTHLKSPALKQFGGRREERNTQCMVDWQLEEPADFVYALSRSGVIAAANRIICEEGGKVTSGRSKSVSQCERIFLGYGIVNYPEETACDFRGLSLDSLIGELAVENVRCAERLQEVGVVE